MEDLNMLFNLISYFIFTIFIIIFGIKAFNVWKSTKVKDIEIKEEIKNYYRRLN